MFGRKKEHICNNPDHDHSHNHAEKHEHSKYLRDYEHGRYDDRYEQYMDYIKTTDYYGPDRRSEKDSYKSYLISILVLVVTNIGAAIWWASGITEDINSLKSRPELSARVIKLEASVDIYNEYFAKLDSTLTSIQRLVSDIDKEQTRNSYIINKLDNSDDDD